MKHTKRLFLVDEFDSEYKRLQHPAGTVAKARSTVRSHKTLKNSELNDHEKARQYVAKLHRYLNRKELMQQPQQQPSVQKIAINTTTPNVTGTKKKNKTKKKPVTPEKYSTDWSSLQNSTASMKPTRRSTNRVALRVSST